MDKGKFPSSLLNLSLLKNYHMVIYKNYHMVIYEIFLLEISDLNLIRKWLGESRMLNIWHESSKSEYYEEQKEEATSMSKANN